VHVSVPEAIFQVDQRGSTYPQGRPTRYDDVCEMWQEHFSRRGEGLVWVIGAYSIPAGSITAGPKSITRTMGWLRYLAPQYAIASADQPPLSRLYSATGTVLRCR